MFLLNSVEAKRDWDGLCDHVRGIIEKHGGEVLREEHWDDRRLAYEVAGQKRGTYLLVFFRLDPNEMSPLRRDFELSERILRQLILRHKGDQIPAYARPSEAPSDQTAGRAPEPARVEAGSTGGQAEGEPKSEVTGPAEKPEAAEGVLEEENRTTSPEPGTGT